ncbi:MAG: hypothetical protein AAFU85_12375 [Planctomycetota bacterium]
MPAPFSMTSTRTVSLSTSTMIDCLCQNADITEQLGEDKWCGQMVPAINREGRFLLWLTHVRMPLGTASDRLLSGAVTVVGLPLA